MLSRGQLRLGITGLGEDARKLGVCIGELRLGLVLGICEILGAFFGFFPRNPPLN